MKPKFLKSTKEEWGEGWERAQFCQNKAPCLGTDNAFLPLRNSLTKLISIAQSSIPHACRCLRIQRR